MSPRNHLEPAPGEELGARPAWADRESRSSQPLASSKAGWDAGAADGSEGALPVDEALLDAARAGATLFPGPAARLRHLELPVDLIVTDDAEREPSEALLEEFEQDGALGCIDVRARPDGLYDLIDGSRRLRCARRRGQPTIAAIVEPAETARLPKDLRALLLNTQRQNLQQLQIALRARRLIEQEGWTQADLARRIHRSRSALCVMLEVIGCPDLVAAVRDEGMAFGAARALAALPREERRPLLETLTETARQAGRFPSVREIEALARRRGRGSSPRPADEATPANVPQSARGRGGASPGPAAVENAWPLLEQLRSQGGLVQLRVLHGPPPALQITVALTDEDLLSLEGAEPAAAGGPAAGRADALPRGNTDPAPPGAIP